MGSAFGTGFVPDLIVGKSKIAGRGVFAGKRYRSSEVIATFGGELHTQAELPEGSADGRFLQVGPELFLAPDPAADAPGRYLNHGCDPNAAVMIRPDGSVQAVAIRPIEPMDEIVYDYSVTMSGDPWTMDCHCGSPKCRFVIREFRSLPAEAKARYRWINVVPAYVLAGDAEAPAPGV